MSVKLKLIFVVAVIFQCGGVLSYVAAQEESSDKVAKKEAKATRKEAKAAKKRERELRDKANFLIAKSALESDEWVLEADMVFDRKGRSVSVSSNINFVAVEGEDVYVQLAFSSVAGGPNGIGGITLKGRLTDKNIQESKSGSITYTMKVIGVALTADIVVRMGGGGNYADAQVQSATSRSKLRFSGVLVPKSQSTYYRSGFDY